MLQYMQSTTRHGKMLRVADTATKDPRRRRFNYDLDEAIKDSMRKPSGPAGLRELSKS